MNSNKQSVEEIQIERPVKTTTQILSDKGLFDSYDNSIQALGLFLLVERRKTDLS